MNEELRERIKKRYADTFESMQFRMSMGEIQVHTVSMSSLLAFLSQAITERAYTDPVYLTQLMLTHNKLTGMMAEIKRYPGYELTGHYFWCMTSGTLIEHALMTLNALHKEDGKV